MDVSLLHRFADAARGRLCGRSFGPVRWLRPLLVLPVGGGRDRIYLVVITETPGPFCFLAAENPLEGVSAATRFPHLAGAKIQAVERLAGDRILEIKVNAAGDIGGELTLRLLLFGSAGRIEVTRENAVLQYVGGRLRSTSGRGRRPAPTQLDGPYYLLSNSRPGRVSPFTEDDPGAAYRFGPFEDALDACREVGGILLEQTRERMIAARMKPLIRKLASRNKLLSRLREELAGTGDHVRIRREAETMAAYQTQIKSGLSSIELPDVYDPDVPLRIDLDPSVPVRRQIEKRFKLAAKLERSEAHTRRRIQEITAEIDAIEECVAGIEQAGDFAAASGLLDRFVENTPGFEPRKSAGARPSGTTGFRRFELDEMWFVLVGRNNQENDELTFHAAAPTDLWFHAQHVPGSHVVLKSRGNPGAPPARILEQTASIAAYFSKSRHSGLVPVIYTQRKYVRKPRGAKAGLVTCEREKMIMAAPELPAGGPNK